MILDIHTHHAVPQPLGIVAVRLGKDSPGGDAARNSFVEEQLYSVGIHPWDTVEEVPEELWEQLAELGKMPNMVAIGEAGLDLTPNGGPMFRQLQVFKRQAELAEELGKPLVIHDVKAHDMIAGLRNDLHPTQNWAIHGFRRKPEVARMLVRAGCYISFGAIFNADTLRSIPEDRILAETDESPLHIEEVVANLSAAYGKNLRETIAANSAAFLSGQHNYDFNRK